MEQESYSYIYKYIYIERKQVKFALALSGVVRLFPVLVFQSHGKGVPKIVGEII